MKKMAKQCHGSKSSHVLEQEMKNPTLNAKVAQIFSQKLQRKIKIMKLSTSQGNIKRAVSHKHSVLECLDINTDLQKAHTKLPILLPEAPGASNTCSMATEPRDAHQLFLLACVKWQNFWSGFNVLLWKRLEFLHCFHSQNFTLSFQLNITLRRKYI